MIFFNCHWVAPFFILISLARDIVRCQYTRLLRCLPRCNNIHYQIDKVFTEGLGTCHRGREGEGGQTRLLLQVDLWVFLSTPMLPHVSQSYTGAASHARCQPCQDFSLGENWNLPLRPLLSRGEE